MRTIITLLILIAICSCGKQIKTEDINAVSIDTSRYYFPVSLFKDTIAYIGSDTSIVERYTRYLKALGEPILSNKDNAKEIYRFLLLRTFDKPIAIRVERYKDTSKLYWKVSSGKGGYAPGELEVYKSRQLHNSEWDKFQNLVIKMDFWNAKTVEGKLHGDDGSHWIIEGVGKQGYHVTDRWSPKDNEFFSCGEYLIELTDLRIPTEDIY